MQPEGESTAMTISNVELFNRIRRLRREAEASYRAGRWQDGWALEGEANQSEDELYIPHNLRDRGER
jgi:hypothetical protein